MKGREAQKTVSSAEPEQGTGVQGERQSQELQEALRGQCGKGSVGRAVLAAAPGEGFYLAVTVFFSFSPFNLH